MHTVIWSIATFFVGSAAGITVIALIAVNAPVRAAKIKAREDSK